MRTKGKELQSLVRPTRASHDRKRQPNRRMKSMVAAYCVECGGVFAFSGSGRAPGEKRRVTLRPADCPHCKNHVQAIRFDDLHPKVLALMRQGPRTAAAVLEAYALPLEPGAEPHDDDADLREEIRTTQERAPYLIPLMLAALAALIANSKFDISLKGDINQLVEQIFGPTGALPKPHSDGEAAGGDQKKGDAEYADKKPEKKRGDVAQRKPPRDRRAKP